MTSSFTSPSPEAESRVNLDQETFPSPEAESKAAVDREKFQWYKQWYPVAIIDYLDPKKPHAIRLLGKSLVLWRDLDLEWHCFENACPHRLAPLSEGRIEADGTLFCTYHAWRFRGDGKCVAIPQSKNKQMEERLCQHPKSCASSYPIQERYGLLWVWAESGKEGLANSAERTPHIIDELEKPDPRVKKLFWSQRDFPYGWDYFLENVSDPAHVAISHHNVMGDRYKDAKYVDLPRIRETSTQGGFAFEVVPPVRTSIYTTQDFRPPSLMKVTFGHEDNAKFILVLFVTPTTPGSCRYIGCQVLVKSDKGKTPPGFGFLDLPLPHWLSHILGSVFLHQDTALLHYQERTMGQRGRGSWFDEVYTPNPQDKMPIAFRKWFENLAGGEIPWDESCDPTLPPPEYDKNKLLDVYNSHTKNCRKCQGAIKNIERLKMTAFILGGVCLTMGVMVDARTVALETMASSHSTFWVTSPLAFWGFIGGAGLMAITGALLQKLRGYFFVYLFDHAEND